MALTEQVLTRIEASDRRWLERRAKQERRSVGAIVRNLIRDAREKETTK